MKIISGFRNNSAALFLLLSIVFFAFRLLPLLTAAERSTYIDELDAGTLGMEMRHGLKLPLTAYQWDEYAGECRILGAAASFFFKYLGENLLALKLVPLIFSWGSFGLLFFLVYRFFSASAAVFSAALLIFCPPAFTQLSLLPMAGRSEPLFLGTAAVFVFCEFLYRRRSAAWAFAFGAVSGAAVWFFYGNAVLIAACLAAWVLQGPRKGGCFLAAAAGFAAVFIPGFLLLHNHPEITAGFFSSSVFNYLASAENLARMPRKAAKLFLRGLPDAYVFFPAWKAPAKVLSVSFYLLHAGLLVYCCRNVRGLLKSRSLPLLLVPVLTLAAIVFTGFDIGSLYGFVGVRYLSPWFFYSFALLGIFFADFKWGKPLACIWIALSIFCHEGLWMKEPFARARDYKGYSYQHLGGRGLFFLRPLVNSPEDFIAVTSRFSRAQRFFFDRGLSSFAVDSGIVTLLEDKNISVAEAAALAEPEVRVFFEEWEKRTAFSGDEITPERRRGIAALPFGFYGYPPDLEKSLQELPSDAGADFYWGLGWAVRSYFMEDRARAADWIARFPGKFRPDAVQGFLACEKRYKIPDA